MKLKINTNYQDIIQWNITGTVSRIDILYNNGTGNNTIARYVDASLGKYSWTVPYDLTSNARILIIDNSTGTPSSFCI
jgi:hypothetical protein